MRFDLVVAGVGGQGVALFSQVLARALVREHQPVGYYLHAGLTQLGGSVRSHLRVTEPEGGVLGGPLGPKIPHGGADFIVALETAEAFHALPYLKRGGTALIAEERHVPFAARVRPEIYPSAESVRELVERGGGVPLLVPAGEIARGCGQVLTLNMVMLGAFLAITRLVDNDSAVLTLREDSPRYADSNVEAFWKGYQFIKGVDYE